MSQVNALSGLLKGILVKGLKMYATSFLKEDRVREKMEESLKKKLRVTSRTSIGRELDASGSASIEDLPLTGYNLYRRYFENPREGDLLYPLKDYIRVTTSGTMGRPKTFLLPKPALSDNMMKTGLSSIFIYMHDGEKSTFEMGDVCYTNVPGGSHISAYNTEIGGRQARGFVVLCPDPNLSFQEKVDYFVENYTKIDVAYMTVSTLLDEVYPRIGKPFYLKGFMTQDSSAGILKEEIKRVTGSYPKVTYGSTETMASTMASIEHPGSFFFDWRVLYTEFLPEGEEVTFKDEEMLREPPDTVPMMDVEVGKRYQLVATPYKTDMTRYVMPDIFECVDSGDDVLGTDVPVFRYYARADKLLVLHNFTRIAEEELLQVLKKADVGFNDFTARRELEGSREYMALYLETPSKMPAEEFGLRIHRALIDMDKDWRDLTDFFKYVPLKLHLLPRGTFNRYLGMKQGMPSVDRIEMREENYAELLRAAVG